VAEFKEFERRFKFKPRLKFGWFQSNVSRFKPALNLNRGFADLNRGSNSLNSISVLTGAYSGICPGCSAVFELNKRLN